MSKMIRMTDYKQLMEVKSLAECNKLLGEGWVCAKIVDHSDGITYIMGLV